MQIPEKILRQMEALKSRGDIQAIADKLGVSYAAVYRAFNEGNGRPEVVEGIAEFYAEREELFREYMD